MTAGVYVLIFLFEDFPLLMVAAGLATCIAYFFVLKTFPFFDLSSPPFIASVGKETVCLPKLYTQKNTTNFREYVAWTLPVCPSSRYAGRHFQSLSDSILDPFVQLS